MNVIHEKGFNFKIESERNKGSYYMVCCDDKSPHLYDCTCKDFRVRIKPAIKSLGYIDAFHECKHIAMAREYINEGK